MPLINRITRLFRSDMHAVLDRIEEPDILLKQAVREMEEDISRDERRLKLLGHEQADTRTRQDDLEHNLEQLDEELDICFASGKEDLARVLTRRKLEAGRQLKTSARKQQQFQADLAELEARLAENRVRLETMKQKLVILTERLDSEQEQGHCRDYYNAHGTTVSNEDVEVAFLREKQKRVAA